MALVAPSPSTQVRDVVGQTLVLLIWYQISVKSEKKNFLINADKTLKNLQVAAFNLM